jgi:hypothetical protein
VRTSSARQSNAVARLAAKPKGRFSIGRAKL